ncbi:MAG: DUF1523 family protein [Pseudomonadota bacterium]
MGYVKWVFFALILALIASFLHYYLPQNDVVRIVSTEVVREDFETTDAQGNAITRTRDVRYIKAAWPDGSPSVYANEDTGWGFPFYFKFDTANLAAEADSSASTPDNPKWMLVRHYGWRITYWSWFPNAVSLRPADGPDSSPFPWFNAIFLTVLITGVLVLYRMLIILRKRHVDPVVEAIDEEIDETAGWWRRQWKRLFG